MPATGPVAGPAPLALAARDASDFEGLYRAEAGRVFALCLRMVADPSRAEELTQETFVRAWHKRATFRGEAALATWLRKIAVNVVLADRRTRGRRPEVELAASPAGGEPHRAAPERDAASGVDLEKAVAALPDGTPSSGWKRWRHVDLEKAVAALPDGARTVFVLHDVEGYTHAEIGALLDVAAVTSKSQLRRARKLLREALQR